MKNQKLRKLLGILLTIAIILTVFPSMFASAASLDVDAITAQRIAEIRATNNTDTSSVTGTIYYISCSGDDTNDGTTPESAWKTIDKLNSYTFTDGDAVLFERGSIFRGHFTINYSLLLGSYGTGAKPRVYGSVDAVAIGSWTEIQPNIWKYSDDTRYDIGNIVFEGDSLNENALFGHKILTDNQTTYDDESISSVLVSDLQFYSKGYASSNYHVATSLYLYSEGNPNERFSQIELCEDKGSFVVRRSNVHVDNIEFRYAGGHGVHGGTSTGLTVTNCEFGWIGGGVHQYKGDGIVATRFGNAVEIYGTANNYTVSNNYIWQVYDAGITPQYTAGEKESIMNNILFSDNVIEYCNYSIEYWNSSEIPTARINNFVIEDNIMRFAGRGLCTDRPDKNQAAHIKSWGNYQGSSVYKNEATDFVIRNNIMDTCDGKLMFIYSDSEESLPVFENNTILQTKGGKGILITITDGKKNIQEEYIPSLVNATLPGNNCSYSDLDDTQTGTADDISWTLDVPTGALSIGGSGEVTATEDGSAPWASFALDIRSVTIGEGITSLGNYSFSGCENLRSISAPSASSYLSGNNGDVSWSFNPESAELTVSGTGAIEDCEMYSTPWNVFSYAVKTLTIGEGITSIGTYAFYGFTHLERINFNAVNCSNLAKDPKNGNNGTNYSFAFCGINSDGIEVVFGENVTRVPNHLFRPSAVQSDSPNVKTISFAGNKCTQLGDHCFRTLDDLVSITLPSSLTKIGTFAFGNCSALEEVVIPSSVTSLGGYLFMNCAKLKKVTMPENASWGYNVASFANCPKLEEINLPSGTSWIGESMFKNCASLTSISIPDTVTGIGKTAFSGCSSLSEILIPASVTTITDGAVGFTNSVKNDNLVIKCYSGSVALTYAENNTFAYVIMDHYGHTESETVVTAPTCTKEGTGEIRCSCGELIETVAYPATGHLNIVADSAVDPTCTTTGLTEGSHCADCGIIIKAQTVVSANVHNEVTDSAVAATCTSTGLTEGSHCADCGTIIKAQTVVSTTAHNEVADSAVAATCTTTGLTEGSHCADCGSVITAQKSVPVSKHADNDSDGMCDACGYIISEPATPSKSCSCNCHKTGFMHFIFRVILFFQKLAGKNQTCACGIAHY